MNHDRTKKAPPPKTMDAFHTIGVLGKGAAACGVHKLNMPAYNNFLGHNPKIRLLSSAISLFRYFVGKLTLYHRCCRGLGGAPHFFMIQIVQQGKASLLSLN